MLSKKIFHLINRLALFAIVFASLAPTISHALEKKTINSFSQTICSAESKKIILQVFTSKGETISTVFETEQSDNSFPSRLNHHFKHCPFCAKPCTTAATEAPHTDIFSLLALPEKEQSPTKIIVLNRFFTLPPPAQAPPNL